MQISGLHVMTITVPFPTKKKQTEAISEFFMQTCFHVSPKRFARKNRCRLFRFERTRLIFNNINRTSNRSDPAGNGASCRPACEIGQKFAFYRSVAKLTACPESRSWLVQLTVTSADMAGLIADGRT